MLPTDEAANISRLVALLPDEDIVRHVQALASRSPDGALGVFELSQLVVACLRNRPALLSAIIRMTCPPVRACVFVCVCVHACV